MVNARFQQPTSNNNDPQTTYAPIRWRRLEGKQTSDLAMDRAESANVLIATWGLAPSPRPARPFACAQTRPDFPFLEERRGTFLPDP